jgi:hypothetical protein
MVPVATVPEKMMAVTLRDSMTGVMDVTFKYVFEFDTGATEEPATEVDKVMLTGPGVVFNRIIVKLFMTMEKLSYVLTCAFVWNGSIESANNIKTMYFLLFMTIGLFIRYDGVYDSDFNVQIFQ